MLTIAFQQIAESQFNYDAWFDYIRLLMTEEAERTEVEDVFERAIANVPPYLVVSLQIHQFYLFRKSAFGAATSIYGSTMPSMKKAILETSKRHAKSTGPVWRSSLIRNSPSPRSGSCLRNSKSVNYNWLRPEKSWGRPSGSAPKRNSLPVILMLNCSWGSLIGVGSCMRSSWSSARITAWLGLSSRSWKICWGTRKDREPFFRLLFRNLLWICLK